MTFKELIDCLKARMKQDGLGLAGALREMIEEYLGEIARTKAELAVVQKATNDYLMGNLEVSVTSPEDSDQPIEDHDALIDAFRKSMFQIQEAHINKSGDTHFLEAMVTLPCTVRFTWVYNTKKKGAMIRKVVKSFAKESGADANMVRGAVEEVIREKKNNNQ